MKEMLLQEKNIDWENDIPIFIKHGIYCKKILYLEQFQPRHDYICKQFKIHFSKDNLDMLLNKYWDNDDDNVVDINHLLLLL
jgi:hypothetical protein